MFLNSINTGTTIMAVEYNEGVVIGADTRSTATLTGGDVFDNLFVTNCLANKIIKITDNIFSCHSGSCAFTQRVENAIINAINLRNLSEKREITVEEVAKMFWERVYRNKKCGAFIISGWDKINKGQVYQISIDGIILRQFVAIEGSGSNLIHGLVYHLYDKLKISSQKNECERTSLAEKDAVEFVKDCLTQAIASDPNSGGKINITIINEHESDITLYECPRN